MGLDPNWAIIRQAYNGFGGNINDFCLALKHVVETDAWRSYNHPVDGHQEPPSFKIFIKQVFEVEPDIVETMLRKSNAVSAANKVLAMICNDLAAHRRPTIQEQSDRKDSNTTFTGERGSAYVIARLKRDDPDLADQVIAGNMSAHAAAKAKDIRRPRFTVLADDPAAAVKNLLRYYTREQLIAALNQP